MILQPYIENSIIHGFADLEGEGIIEITFSLTDTVLKCHIVDNGINNDVNDNPPVITNQQSLGLLITKERLSLLQDPSVKDLNAEVSKNETEGTQVHLDIPYKLR